jgi:hypothetical protein
LDAARDTWRLIKDRGFDAIINDLLIDNVLTMGSILISYITAFLCYLYLKYTDPAYNSSGGFSAPIIAFGFLIGLQMVIPPPHPFPCLLLLGRGSRCAGLMIRQTSQLFLLKVVLRHYLLRWRRILRPSLRISQIYIK